MLLALSVGSRRLPGNYPARYFAQRGGLMGIDSDAAYRTATRRAVPGSRLLPADRGKPPVKRLPSSSGLRDTAV